MIRVEVALLFIAIFLLACVSQAKNTRAVWLRFKTLVLALLDGDVAGLPIGAIVAVVTRYVPGDGDGSGTRRADRQLDTTERYIDVVCRTPGNPTVRKARHTSPEHLIDQLSRDARAARIRKLAAERQW